MRYRILFFIPAFFLLASLYGQSSSVEGKKAAETGEAEKGKEVKVPTLDVKAYWFPSTARLQFVITNRSNGVFEFSDVGFFYGSSKGGVAFGSGSSSPRRFSIAPRKTICLFWRPGSTVPADSEISGFELGNLSVETGGISLEFARIGKSENL